MSLWGSMLGSWFMVLTVPIWKWKEDYEAKAGGGGGGVSPNWLGINTKIITYIKLLVQQKSQIWSFSYIIFIIYNDGPLQRSIGPLLSALSHLHAWTLLGWSNIIYSIMAQDILLGLWSTGEFPIGKYFFCIIYDRCSLRVSFNVFLFDCVV